MVPLPISLELRSALWWPMQSLARTPRGGHVWRVLLNARVGRCVSLQRVQIREVYRVAMEVLVIEEPPAPEAAALRRLLRFCERTKCL